MCKKKKALVVLFFFFSNSCFEDSYLGKRFSKICAPKDRCTILDLIRKFVKKKSFFIQEKR